MDDGALPTVIRETNIGANPEFVKDIFMKKSPEALIKDWETEPADGSVNFAVRDSLIDVMLRKSLRPSEWLRRRDVEHGLYPDIDDPDFAALLFRKTEFASLSSVMAEEDTCTRSSEFFDTTPVQRLVARFLHPSTPYRGLLLNHGVGVGKTCSAITVAETFLDIMPQHCVYILAPQSIADGFKKTIFDVNRLRSVTKADYALTGERWTSPQCTGMTYLRLTGMAGSESRDDIVKEVDKVVRTRYNIMGYLAFANWVQRKFNAIPSLIVGKARKDREAQILTQLFADHLIIVDEAHNLRDSDVAVDVDEPADDDVDVVQTSDAAQGKKLTPILKQLVRQVDGLRLMLMTATPMYNTAFEILFLLNLLSANDTKDESMQLKERDVFKADGSFVAGGADRLAKIAKRYVSYMRGENPNTFPLRLTPPESAGHTKFFEDYPEISISRKEGVVKLKVTDDMSNSERLTAQNIMKVLKTLPLVVTHVRVDTPVGELLSSTLEKHANPPKEVEATAVSTFLLDQTMQIGNITYPSGVFGTRGWESYMHEESVLAKGTTVSQFTWTPITPETGVAPSLESVFAGDGLKAHAPKIDRIVKSIKKAKGMSFIYSRYVKGGALPIAIALELAGWCRVLADGTPAPLLKQEGKRTYKHYYVLLTSNEGYSGGAIQGLVDYATIFKDVEEASGTKVKAIIGSQVASEGLDLKCIREIHLLDGWYHLNRIEQIEGRGVRFCSHVMLPLSERNCLIYLHAVCIPKYESADLYAYRIAVRKALPIGQVSRLMKINAWDCMLNIDAILLKDMPARQIVDARGRDASVYGFKKGADGIARYSLEDKPFTSFCDYSTQCEYQCAKKPDVSEGSVNDSTFKEFDYRRMFLRKEELLQSIFAEEVAIPLEVVRDLVYGDIPWAIGAIGLREALGQLKIRRNDGIYGTLVLQNGYVVFQPEYVSDTYIPLASRYGRAYARLPRVARPLVATETEKVAVDHYAKAKESLSLWKGILERILTMDSGEIKAPLGFNDDAFRGWRWLFNHFQGLDETRSIAYKWWMDNVWTTEQRRAMLDHWTRVGITNLGGDDMELAKLFRPVELYKGGELSGYLLYNVEESHLESYCFIEGSAEPGLCTPLYKDYVEAAIGKPVVRDSAGTGAIFGMLVTKKNKVIFKSVDKDSGKLEGAECSNTSNLGPHERRIKLLQEVIRSSFPANSPIRLLLLEDAVLSVAVDKTHHREIQEALERRYKNPESAKPKTSKPVPTKDLNITHVSHMSVKQACPYMEFLLRWMDIHRVQGKRWFLSLVDSDRAGVKMA